MNSQLNFMLYMTPNDRRKWLTLTKSILNSGNTQAYKQVLNMHKMAGNSIDISKLTVPKLKNLAKKHGIPLRPGMKKANIIKKLRGQ